MSLGGGARENTLGWTHGFWTEAKGRLSGGCEPRPTATPPVMEEGCL